MANLHQGPIVILGATGHIGGRIARFLLDRRDDVRVVGRSAERLAGLTAGGAQAWVGELEDDAFLTRAFATARAAFIMIPTDLGAADPRGVQDRISQAQVKALRESGVAYVVNLSSIGAEVPYGTGPIAGLHAHEERLNAIDGLNVVHLRPASFMENLLSSIPGIRQAGSLFGGMRPDLPEAMIATRDIAAEADRLLAELGFADKETRELLGPRDYTMTEVAGILGAAIGKPDLAYVQVPLDKLREAMVGAGLSPAMADLYVEMIAAFDSGKVHPAEPRLPENTTPTTLEEFAPTFAAAYGAAAEPE